MAKKVILVFLIIGLCIACDQAAKATAVKYLSSSPPVPFLDGMLRFQSIKNPGVIQSLGADWPYALRFWLFTVFAGVILTVLLGLVLFSGRVSYMEMICVCLILGGGLSNLLDRLVHQGAVIDMMDVTVGEFRTGIFNLADVAMTVGLGLLIFAYLRRRVRVRSKA
jgi:signal peptidase II